MNRYLFDSDYSTDSLRWIKWLENKKLRNNHYSKDKSGYNPEDLEKIQNEIIKNNDAALAYFFSIEFNYKHYRMQKVILESKNPKYSFLFAQNITNADIKALQSIVLLSNDIKYICKFACFVKGSELKSLEDIVIKSKNVKYAHMMLKYTKNPNIDKYKQIIIDSKKPRYLFELAKHIKNQKDLSKIEDLIIASGSFTYIRILAEKIKLSNLEKIERAILDTQNTKEIKKFATYVKRSKMKRFLLVL